MTEATPSRNVWLDGYHQALEDVAKFIEENVKATIDPHRMMPRLPSNKHGLEYADAIRRMKGTGL